MRGFRPVFDFFLWAASILPAGFIVRHAQLGLTAGKVVVERAARSAAAGQNFVQPGAVIAALLKELRGALEQALTPFASGLLDHAYGLAIFSSAGNSNLSTDRV